MAQCVQCGKKGLFLKVDSHGVCESCNQAAKNRELEARKQANEKIQEIYKTVESMQTTVNVISDLHDSNCYSKENVDSAIQMLTISVDKLKSAISGVKTEPLDQLENKIADLEETVKAFEPKLQIIKDKPETGNSSLSYRRHYHLVGVSFKNEDGTSRQGVLRRIKYNDLSYAFPAVTVKQYDYNGEPAVGVYANGTQVGNIAKEDIPELLKNNDDLIDAYIKVLGGTPDKNCGAEVILTYKC